MSAFPDLICDTQFSGDSAQGKVNKLLLEYFVQTELLRMSDNSSQPVSSFNEKQMETSNNFASAIVKTQIETTEKKSVPEDLPINNQPGDINSLANQQQNTDDVIKSSETTPVTYLIQIEQPSKVDEMLFIQNQLGVPKVMEITKCPHTHRKHYAKVSEIQI